MRGVKPREVLMYWGGDERGNDFSGPPHDYSWCVPIGTQNLHAAGAALAFKLRGEPRVAVCCVGDGGSSKTDTYAAINSAGAYTLPFIQCIINNGWAISVPRKAQTGAKTLAQKGIAGGLESLQVDGNGHHTRCARHGLRAQARRATGHGGSSSSSSPTACPTTPTGPMSARRYRGRAGCEGRLGTASLVLAPAQVPDRLKVWTRKGNVLVEEQPRPTRGSTLPRNQRAAGRGDVRFLYGDMPPTSPRSATTRCWEKA
jgi:hypothetical protein